MKPSSISYFLSNFLLVITLLFFIIFPVCAEELRDRKGTQGLILRYVSVDCFKKGNCTLSDFLLVFKALADLMLSVLGAVALLFFVLGGVIWLTSGGSAGQVERGRKILSGAVIGVIIVLGAWTLVNFTIVTLMPEKKDGERGGVREKFFGKGGKWWIIPRVRKPAPTEKKTEKKEVDRGKECGNGASCQEGLECKSHHFQSKKICVKLNSKEMGGYCIPVKEGNECKGGLSCEDTAYRSPSNCKERIECGRCSPSKSSDGRVVRGGGCKENGECQVGLACRPHLTQTGIKVCVHLESKEQDGDCIPVGPLETTESECKGTYGCNDAARPPRDCDSVIICGRCK